MGKTTIIIVFGIEQSLLNILVLLDFPAKLPGSVVSLYDVVILVEEFPVDIFSMPKLHLQLLFIQCLFCSDFSVRVIVHTMSLFLSILLRFYNKSNCSYNAFVGVYKIVLRFCHNSNCSYNVFVFVYSAQILQ